MDTQFDAFFLTTGTQKIGIQPDGCYVSSWMIGDLPILYVGSLLKRSGIPLLFPYFGKAEGKRMHGFGRNVLWQIKEQSNEVVTMSITEDQLDDAMLSEYPYHFEALVTIDGSTERSLAYTLSIRNNDEINLPIAPGLHPYWAIAHGEKSQLRIEGIGEFDAQMIDWDQAPPDNNYACEHRVRICIPEKTIVIEDQSKPACMEQMVVWSQTPLRDPDYDFVCVEPTTRVHFDFDTNPILIAPQENWQMKILFSVE